MAVVRQPIEPVNPSKSRWANLPTMYDLPSEEPGDPGLPDEFHRFQADLLDKTCRPSTHAWEDVFVACDLNLYYDVHHTQWYKRPDWFVVLGIPRFLPEQGLRLSYVIWQEFVTPFLVLELLSPGTEAEDLGQTLRDVERPPTKWEVYEQILRIPYYVVYDRYENNFRAFRLEGTRYQEISLVDQRFWLEELQLGLGLWQGDYEGVTALWLRWYDPEQQWIPTPAEQVNQERQRADQERQRADQERQRADQERQRADQEHQRADQERQRADQERQQAERLAERLRQAGIDPDAV